MRIRGYDEETEEFKDDVEELNGAIANLTKTAQHPGGVSLFKDAAKTEFKSTYEILRDISAIYDELTDKQQAQLLEKLAGKRGGQVLAGILSPEKFKEVERALQEMEVAAGSADAEMGIIEESIDFKLNKLKQTWVGVLQEILHLQDLSNIITFFTTISEGLGGIAEKIGVVGIAITGLGLVTTIKNFNTISSSIRNLYSSFIQVGTKIQEISTLHMWRNGATGLLTPETYTALSQSIDGLTKQQALLVLSSKGLKKEEAERVLIEAGLVAKDGELSASMAKRIIAEKGLSTEQKKRLMTSIGIAEADTEEALVSKIVTKQTIDNAVASGTLTAAEGNQLAVALGLTSANTALATSLKASAIAAGQFALALLTNPITYVVAAIAGLIAVIHQTRKANESLKESAKETGDAFKEDTKDIEDYKKEVSDLHDKINDNSTSIEDSKEARKRLLEIQDELITKYGYEADAINTITDAVNGSIDAFDNLAKIRWQEKLNEFNSQNLEGIDWINQLVHGTNSQIGVALAEMDLGKGTNRNVLIDPSDAAYFKSLQDIFNFTVSDDNTFITLNGNLEQVYSNLLKIRSVSQDKISNESMKSLASYASEANETIKSFGEIVHLYTLYEDILDSELEDNWKDWGNTYQKYKDAVINQNEELAASELDNLKSQFKALEEELSQSDLDLNVQTRILDEFRNAYPQLKQEIQSWDFETHISTKLDIDTPEINKAKQIASEKSGIDIDFVSQSIDDLKSYIAAEKQEAANLGVDLERTVFGNIDTNRRQILEWTDENLEKYKDALMSWADQSVETWEDVREHYQDSYSTVDSDTTSIDGLTIAYTPILNTEHGPEYLSKETVDNYLLDVFKKASEDGDYSLDNILKIDAEGINGIKNLIEDVGETAQLVSESAHFTGLTGSIKKSEQELAILQQQVEKYNEIYNNIGNETIFTDDGQELINNIKKFSNAAELLSMENKNKYNQASDQMRTAYDYIKNEAEYFGMSVEQLLQAINRLNGVRPSFMLPSEAKTAIGNILQPIAISTKDYDIEFQKLAYYFNTLDETEQEIFINFQKKYKGYWFNFINEFEAELERIAKKAKEDSEKFSLENFSVKLDGLDKIVSIYDNVKEELQKKADNDPIKIPIDIKDIEALRKDESFSQAFEDIDFSNAFNQFEQLATSADTTKAEFINAYETVATEYVDAMIRMNGATEDNIAIIESQLVKRGFEKQSIQEYIQQQQQRALVENFVNQNLKDGHTVEQEKINDLINEADQIGLTNDKLDEYLANAIAAGNIVLSGDTSWLDTLAEKLDIDISKLKTLRALAANGAPTDIKGVGTTSYTQLNEMQSRKLNAAKRKNSGEVDDNTSKLKVNTAALDDNAKSSGGAADKTDEHTDAISKINAEIDALQDAYEKLTKIQETFNEYGHITIDQAQELSQMDFRYLAQFSDESGNINANAEAFDRLTQARIQELQVAMIRRAMDLISTFTNEAVAAEYLGNSFLDTASKGLTLIDVLNQINNAQLGVNGKAAAMEVYNGLKAGLQMVGSVDPQLTLSGAGGGGHEPMDRAGSREGEGEGAGQSYEQDFDWIEKLLERLNKLTAKWTDRADRFFTFWNKNWATNKAIQANQKEQEANQKAYTYYLKQANKVDIDKDYKNRIQNGSMLAEVIEDEELGKKIEEYQKWYDKMQECEEKLQELRDAERDMILQKLDNILEYYDKIQNYFDSVLGKLESRISAKNAWGQRTEFSDLIEEYAANEEGMAKAIEKQFVYQTGLVKENVRESADILADIADDEKRLDLTNAYTAAQDRLTRLNEKKATWDDAKKDIAFLNQYKNKYKKGKLDENLKNQFEDILAEYNTDDANVALIRAKQRRSENQWTQKDKNALTATTKELEAFASILQNTTDYYDQATERSQELSEKDKLKKSEEKEKAKIDASIQTMKALDNPYLTKWYTEALQTKDQLEKKKAPVQAQIDRINELNDLINNETDKWQRDQYTKERNQLQKEVNKVWKQKDDKLLTNVTRQLQAIEDIRNQGIVDNEVASTATYQNLLRQIGDLQSKKTLNPQQQEKLAMLLEEMREINAGVLAEDIAVFNTAYQAWWKQNQKELTLENHTQQWQNKETKWKALQQRFKEQQSELQKELNDALVVEGAKEADLTLNFERTLKELRSSYGAQLDEAQNGFENSAVYKQFKTTYENNKSKYEKLYADKGKEQTAAAKKLKATIEKQEEQLAEMRAGATQENFEEYWEAIKWLDNHRTAHDNGTLGSLAGTWDKYEAKVNTWKKAKQEEVDAIQKEMDDKIAEVTNEYDTNVANNEQEINERHEKLGEAAKQLAEFEISSIKEEIAALEGLINRAESIAHMLENTSFDALRKNPSIMKFLGLDSDKELSELLTEQLSTAISAATDKISESAELANMYQELIDAAKNGKGGFAGIFAKYRENASKEMQKTIDSLIERLNDANLSESTWIDDWNNGMAEAVQETIEGIEHVQELKNEFRENVVFKAVNNAIEQLNSLQGKLGSMANVIHDDWVMAGDSITEYGLAKIYMLGQQMKTAQEETAKWGEKVKQINNIIAGNNWMAEYGSREEAEKALNEAIQNQYTALQNESNYAYQAYQLVQRVQEEEVNSIKKLIDVRKKALQAKRDYYEYDKTIKKQTKDVEALKAQIEALNGVK